MTDAFQSRRARKSRSAAARRRKRRSFQIESLEDRRMLAGLTSEMITTSLNEVAPGVFIEHHSVPLAVRQQTSGLLTGEAEKRLNPNSNANLNGNGLQFAFNVASGTPQTVVDGFAEAAQLWAQELSDDILVTIDISFPVLGSGILGSTGSTDTTVDYSAFRTQLTADTRSADDLSAVANLASGSSVDLYINRTADNPNGSGNATPYVDNNGDDNNNMINLTTANAKAIGGLGIAAGSTVVDADISFSSVFTWDFDRSDGISSNAFDFVATAAHEIGHALGFISGVDFLDGNGGSPGGGPFNADQFKFVNPLDMFRYSADSVTATGGPFIDWTADTRTKSFSIDGGNTFLTTFSTGTNFGDGQQASHWKDDLGIGLMDPTGAPGELTNISAFDIQSMDVIGWDIGFANDGEQIRGVKFNDRDSDGLLGTNEEGLEGWTIYLDANNNSRLDAGETSTVTAADGSYELQASVGTHIVREVAQPFWTQTSPGGNGSHTVVLALVNEDAADIDFGNVADVAQIYGVEWLDENQNGVRDAGEPGLPGVVINAVGNIDGVVRSTLTGPFGKYAFLSLPPDTYTVTDTLTAAAGYTKTFPTTLDHDHTVLLHPNQKRVDIDFGNFAQRGTISGIKFEDRNGNEVQDLNEFGIGGVRIYVDTNRDSRLSVGEPSAITKQDGTYQIRDIPPGTYIVREVAVPGQQQTFPTNVGSQTVVVTPGADTPSVNFGNRDHFDFGDAPANYPTLSANQGARHAIIPGFFLGASVDSETDGQPSLLANGDDNGSGGFATAAALNVGVAPAGGAAGDLNGDGFADLAIVDQADNTVSVLLNNGDGTYAQRVANSVGTGPVDVAMGDFDGDGDTDLAVANLGSSNVSILLNRGDGTFEAATSFGSGSRPASILAADLNGAAGIDLIVANSGSQTVSLMFGIGDGTFEAPQPFDINEGRVTDVALADFDRNGTLDVVATSPDSDRVSILLNDGAGMLGVARDFIVGDGPSSVFAGDFNRDGAPDIAVANQLSGTVSVLRNRGTGSFFPAATYTVNAAPTSILGADLDGDGDTDLAIATGALGEFPVLVNNGDGVFDTATAFKTGVATNALVSADLNGDGAADLVAINTAQNDISLILSNGDDEDGIVLSGDLRTGESASANVTASLPGVLNAWVDFNRNGVWEANEQIATNVHVPAGVSTVFFTVPNGGALGTSYARFRFSLEENIGPSGDAPSGEVEDYQVSIIAGGSSTTPRSAYTNPTNRFDVDGNGAIELADVLSVINALRGGARPLPNPPPPGTPLPPFIDVSGDGNLTLNDILLVVNALFAQLAGVPLPPPGPRPPAAAEGESLDPLAVAAAVSDPEISQQRVTTSTESLALAAAADDAPQWNLQSSRSAPGARHTVPIYGGSTRNSARTSSLETSLDEIALDVHNADGSHEESF